MSFTSQYIRLREDRLTLSEGRVLDGVRGPVNGDLDALGLRGRHPTGNPIVGAAAGVAAAERDDRVASLARGALGMAAATQQHRPHCTRRSCVVGHGASFRKGRRMTCVHNGQYRRPAWNPAKSAPQMTPNAAPRSIAGTRTMLIRQPPAISNRRSLTRSRHSSMRCPVCWQYTQVELELPSASIVILPPNHFQGAGLSASIAIQSSTPICQRAQTTASPGPYMLS